MFFVAFTIYVRPNNNSNNNKSVTAVAARISPVAAALQMFPVILLLHQLIALAEKVIYLLGTDGGGDGDDNASRVNQRSRTVPTSVVRLFVRK